MRGVRNLLVSVVILGLAGDQAVLGAKPSTVSPGQPEHWTTIEARCPSFSWSLLPGATEVELAVFPEPVIGGALEVDVAELGPSLLERLPSATSSWTPSLDRCLQPGERYAWFVRGVSKQASGESLPTTEWSEARFFEVSARPSFAEVEAALDVLKRHHETEMASKVALDEERSSVRLWANERSHSEPPRASSPRRIAQPGSTSALLRVEGVIAGDGSELTSVDADTIDGLDSTELGAPSGAVLFFDLGTCPDGWSPFVALRGRVPIGLQEGGSVGDVVGTELGNLGIRTISSVPEHTHEVDPPSTNSSDAGSHSHSGTTNVTNVTLDLGNGGYGTSFVQGSSTSTDLNAGAPADSHNHSFTTDTAAAHSHAVNIVEFSTASTGVAGVDVTMPYIQLLACRKN